MKATEQFTTEIQGVVNSVCFDHNKKNFITALYRRFSMLGYNVVKVNDLYLEINGCDFQFTCSRMNRTYTAKTY